MKKFPAILTLTAVAALPFTSAFADPTPKEKVSANPCSIYFKGKGRAPASDPCGMNLESLPGKDPIGDLIKKFQAMPLDQKIREAFLAISLPLPTGPLLALLDAYAVEKSEQKKIEIKGKIEALLKKHKLGKYATGEMMMKTVDPRFYESKAYKPVKLAETNGPDKEKKKIEAGKNSAQGG
ncbi:MAG: hypothetical protein JST04_14665 [Bdellovibrionales bacterium]|nr:hypothetical protein [Bdellovibrionales bacterium]